MGSFETLATILHSILNYNILSKEGKTARKLPFGNRDINLTKCSVLTITDNLASIRTVKIVP